MKVWVLQLLIGLAMVGLGLWGAWQTQDGPEWSYWLIAGAGASLVAYAGLRSLE